MQQNKFFKFDKTLSFNFKGGELTSGAGILLQHEYNNNAGIKELIEEYYKEDRKGNFYHKKFELLYQQIIRIIEGTAGNNYIRYQNTDPVYQKIHKKNQGSASTITRWTQSFSEKDQENLEKIQQKLIQTFYKNNREKNLILDIDTTYDPASENLEKSSYNHHYGVTGFSPIVAFDGKSGLPILSNLRPGTQYCSKDTDIFLEKIIKNIPDKKIFLRADSGFAAPKIYEVLEKKDHKYVIKMKQYSSIKKVAEEYFYKEIQPKLNKTKQKSIETFYHDFGYKIKTWNKFRKIVVKITVNTAELFPHFQLIITNDNSKNSEEIFNFYNQRAVCENYIEEGKNGFSWDHLSHSKFIQNQVRFQIFFLSMTIFKLFQIHSMNKEDAKKSVQTIRFKFFTVAAKLVRGSRKFKFKLASCFFYQRKFLNIFKNIQEFSWKFG